LKQNTIIHHLFTSQEQASQNNNQNGRDNRSQIISKLKIFRGHDLPFLTIFNEKDKQTPAKTIPTIIRPIKDKTNVWGGKKNGVTTAAPNQPAATVTKKSDNLSFWPEASLIKESFINSNSTTSETSFVKRYY